MQFLASILHDPTILVMDEPSSGLDPVNTNVLKEALLKMHCRGKTIIFSTHQLEQKDTVRSFQTSSSPWKRFLKFPRSSTASESPTVC